MPLGPLGLLSKAPKCPDWNIRPYLLLPVPTELPVTAAQKLWPEVSGTEVRSLSDP